MPLNDGRNKPIDGYGGGSSGGGSSGSSGGRVNLTVGLPVAGYQPQSQIAIDWVNENKRLEEQVLRRLDKLFVAEASDVLVDRRWLEIAKTHIEEGFMAMNRGIFCPQRLKDDQL